MTMLNKPAHAHSNFLKMPLAALALSTAMLLPSLAQAKMVTTTITMKNYNGSPAYVAVYLAAPDGSFHSTLSIRGGRSKYRRHLSNWMRGVSQTGENIDGVSGASVGSGRSFTVQSDISDALLKAGYKVVVDAAVENYNSVTGDAIVSLNADNAKASAAGRGFVKSAVVTY